MRQTYHFDEVHGGQLSVAESAEPDTIIVRIEQADAFAEVRLTEEQFRELAEIRYRLRVVRAPLAA